MAAAPENLAKRLVLAKRVVLGRWMVVFFSFLIMSCAGGTYIFGVYSETIKSALGYDQQTITTLGFFKDLGANVGILSGLSNEILPSSAVVGGGALLNIAGYLMIWLSVTARLPRPKKWQLYLYMTLAANSQTFTNTGSLVTCVKNFPQSRGVVIGILKGYIGLSGAIFTQIYRAIYGSEGRGTAGMILLLGILPSAMSLAVLAFIRPTKVVDDKNEVRRFYQFLYVALLLAGFLLVVIVVENEWSGFGLLGFRAVVAGVTVIILLNLAVVVGAEMDHMRNHDVSVALPPSKDVELVVPRSSCAGSGASSTALQTDASTSPAGSAAHGSVASTAPVSDTSAAPVASTARLYDASTFPVASTAPLNDASTSHVNLTAPSNDASASTVASTSRVNVAAHSNDASATTVASTAHLEDALAFSVASTAPRDDRSTSIVADASAATLHASTPAGASSATGTTSGGRKAAWRRHRWWRSLASLVVSLKAPPLGDDYTIPQALASADMWILFTASTLGLGATLTAVDNMGQIGKSLGYSQHKVSTLVSLISIWNFLGRVGAGYLSETLLRRHGFPRPLMMTGVFVVSCLGHVLIALALPGSLYVASVIIGLCFGATWPLLYAVISELFGLKYYATLFNFGSVSSAVGSYAFSVRVAGYLYDREALRQLPGQGRLPGKELTCTGSECFRVSFIVMTAVTVLAAMISAVLVVRTRTFYRGDIYAKFRGHVGNLPEREDKIRSEQR
eukprot:TRINITY_DN2004_c0_g1_i1.p1 TRINITY_DN2004_c0_g1~~TRINITY_DN2004_c0_g1_i1.p1  ORF type:complete len:736 (-),score=-69.36 TRINITY_DN2004_c0_g1_i1:566-2773(-)